MHKSLLTWMPAMVIAGLVAVSSSYRASLKLPQGLNTEAAFQNEEKSTAFPENYLDLLGSNDLIIRNISFTPPGFVVVREEASGNPSNVIGESKLIGKEAPEFIIVSLSKSIKKDDIIYINYFIDNGDGVFDPSEDRPKGSLFGNSDYIKLIVINAKTDNPEAVRL